MKMSGKRKALYGLIMVLLVPCLCVLGGRAEGDETVELGSIAQYYQPVEFDHEMHSGLIEEDECAICHHHTLGTPVSDPLCIRCHASSGEAESVACRDCHPLKRFSAEYLAKLDEDITLYHVEKPGFQGAIHQCCIGCHIENDAPIGCQDCHTRTDEGDKFYHAGKYAPTPKASAAGH